MIPTLTPQQIFLIALLVTWELIWKGSALWRAARNNHRVWYIAILVINSVGILPLAYLYIFSPQSNKK